MNNDRDLLTICTLNKNNIFNNILLIFLFYKFNKYYLYLFSILSSIILLLNKNNIIIKRDIIINYLK